MGTAQEDTFAKWLSDPIVSRAADRSRYDDNGDVLALLEALHDVQTELEAALPGVSSTELRRLLREAPAPTDVLALAATLLTNGRPLADVSVIVEAIAPGSSKDLGERLVPHLKRDRKAKAIQMLKDGKTAAEVAEATGFSLARVYQIRSQNGLRRKLTGRSLDPARSKMVAETVAALGSQKAAAAHLGISDCAVVNAIRQNDRILAGAAY